MTTARDVLEGRARFSVEAADCLPWLNSLPADSVDLLVTSPPYEKARLYLESGADPGIARTTEQWVAWLVEVVRAASRVCRGLLALVIEGQTERYRYSCGPLLLAADLCRAGFNLRRPCIYRRSGIPGSGGPDWFRCDWELILCVTRPGKLPWADPTACGHPPRWAPGGEMSHRLSDGTRVNQHGITGNGPESRYANGKRRKPSPSSARKPHTKAKPNGTDEQQSYAPPVLANPGNVVQRTYTAEEVTELLGYAGDVVDCVVGGGQMGEGDGFSRQNEAPYPEELPERFIRSFCPPSGIVCDPFSGSGTTAAVALRWGRRFVGCDLRPSQVALTQRRIATETPLSLFPAEDTP